MHQPTCLRLPLNCCLFAIDTIEFSINKQSNETTILQSGNLISTNDQSSSSPEDISKQLLDISKTDIIEEQKPTLILMGSRTDRLGAQGGHVCE